MIPGEESAVDLHDRLTPRIRLVNILPSMLLVISETSPLLHRLPPS